MSIKILNNLPIDYLTEENDYLGIIEKGELIKLFLENNRKQFSEIKMFALYGEWGSGKSTLMKYLQKELKPNFNTFFFDTWEFETDNNLSFSLLEFLTAETKDAMDETIEEFIEVASKLLRGFSRSLRISLPGISIDGKPLIEELESEEQKSFLELKKEFKFQFEQFEDNLKARTDKDYNIIFIDDLDRCEPENVLNLLSALKLFFTYGKRTVFFCGIDKKAVNEAVKTKYKDVIKAEEYLEKIFDISFSMPKKVRLSKLVNQFFDENGKEKYQFNFNSEVENFFVSIGFTNPRRVKKILNKYSILANQKLLNVNVGNLIPDIHIKEKVQGIFIDTLLTLYFLILKEFYPRKLEDFFNTELRKINFTNALKAESGMGPGDSELLRFNNFASSSYSIFEIDVFSHDLASKQSFLKLFVPNNPIFINQRKFEKIIDAQEGLQYFQDSFRVESEGIDYKFVIYLIRNHFENFETILESDYNMNNFKHIFDNYL